MRIYNTLLHLYPSSFRTEYGNEMRSIFARRRRDASGPFSAVALWIGVFFEILFNAIAVHWDLLKQDLRYTARTLGRSRGFALTAIAVVAIGIGATTAAFSVTDFVLIRPLPYPQPERLVKVWERTPGFPRMEFSPANYRDWKRLSKSYEAMGGYYEISVNMVGRTEPHRIAIAAVTWDLLPILGVHPLAGRLFSSTEDRAGAAGTVVLSYRLWQSDFGGDPGIIGRQIILEATPYLVIGVMPRDFNFPSGETQLWMAARFPEEAFKDRNDNYMEVLAKLKQGVSFTAAQAEVDLVAAQLKQQYPKENAHTEASLISLHDQLSQQSRLLLLALSAAAFCVLLIACANLANLLLARVLVRRKELAVRAAMGAGRERLVRQLVTESLVLAFVGGALGVAIAIAAVPLLSRLVPTTLPIALTPSVDFRVLLFAAALTALTGLVFGVVPAFRASSGAATANGLREGSRSGGGRKERLRSALVIAEVVMSVVLLISAGLLLRALWALRAVDPGFRVDNVLTLRTALPMPKYLATSRRVDFYGKVLDGVRALPGVMNAAYISFVPMGFKGGIFPVAVDGDEQPEERSANNVAGMRFVTPGFFSTLGIPLKQGRDVAESDTTADRNFSAVVSESFVRRYWPDQNPLGRHFKVGFRDRIVIGVVGDIRFRGLEQPSEPQVYVPYRQVVDGAWIFHAPKDLVIRYSSNSGALLASIRRIVASADPEQPISDVRPLADIIDSETASRSAQASVLGAFAAIAFLLAGIGIHGVLAFAVSTRSQEIGVRIALGAQARDILGMVMRQGGMLVAAGLVPGIALAYAAGRAIQALLAGVRPFDAPTFLAVAGLCLLMTAVGSLLPALRAVRVDAIAAVRSD